MRTTSIYRLALLSLFALSLSACNQLASNTTANADHSNHTPSTLNSCPDTRPTACSREYKPVCATRDTGVRCVTTPCPSSERVTYANDCSACREEKVYGYTPGACAEPAAEN